jgi:hypothetical protein
MCPPSLIVMLDNLRLRSLCMFFLFVQTGSGAHPGPAQEGGGQPTPVPVVTRIFEASPSTQRCASSVREAFLGLFSLFRLLCSLAVFVLIGLR